ncbi:hypothetical protein QN277_005854 [Acacia crassicarpa]|uniref:Uncharacterized protein n=1 Tax=Acacia crassicarpa TaxID=499986 RepID=A0AAE1IYU9_9FABA|nr:hypothetical protein QN277_005854 [Acacia crassicarpa]
MAVASATNETDEVFALNVQGKSNNDEDACVSVIVPFLQKLVAEFVGTFFLMFAGQASEVVDEGYGNKITLPGTAVVWGLTVLVLVYAVSHISGAHFNPAVTLAFASTGRFPLKQVPAYISVQLLASILASGTLRLIFEGSHDHFSGTRLSGTHLQGFVIEFIITFYIMLVKYSTSGLSSDNREMSQVAGLAVGSTMLLNVMFAGPVTGASMNPARSLGPAIVWHKYKAIWVYVTAPVAGAVTGAWVYNIMVHKTKPIQVITKASNLYDSSK